MGGGGKIPSKHSLLTKTATKGCKSSFGLHAEIFAVCSPTVFCVPNMVANTGPQIWQKAHEGHFGPLAAFLVNLLQDLSTSSVGINVPLDIVQIDHWVGHG